MVLPLSPKTFVMIYEKFHGLPLNMDVVSLGTPHFLPFLPPNKALSLI
jgi:hypothetical protein